jgi:hypothetical protein
MFESFGVNWTICDERKILQLPIDCKDLESSTIQFSTTPNCFDDISSNLSPKESYDEKGLDVLLDIKKEPIFFGGCTELEEIAINNFQDKQGFSCTFALLQETFKQLPNDCIPEDTISGRTPFEFTEIEDRLWFPLFENLKLFKVPERDMTLECMTFDRIFSFMKPELTLKKLCSLELQLPPGWVTPLQPQFLEMNLPSFPKEIRNETLWQELFTREDNSQLETNLVSFMNYEEELEVNTIPFKNVSFFFFFFFFKFLNLKFSRI